MSFKRRSFLQASGALGLGLMACGPDGTLQTSEDGDDQLAIDESELGATFTVDRAAFPLGVMAGDALPKKAVLWTKFDANTVQPLRLRVYEVRRDGTRKMVHGAPVEAADISDAGFVHVDIDGLEADTTYLYRFLFDPGAQNKQWHTSHLGRFRTALPAGSRKSVTFAGICCTNPATGERDEFKVLGDAAKREDLDFVMHLGDHVYADTAHTRAEYREKYDRQWKRTGMHALHKSTVMWEIWDDHEVDNDWNVETISDARLNAARGAAFEHRALRRHATDKTRWYRSFKHGDTAEFWLLDVRSERLPSTRGHAMTAPRPEQFISMAQLAWLQKGLKESTAIFKFIVTPQPFTNWPNSDGNRWDGYREQRGDLCDFILSRGRYASTGLTASERRGLFFLGGDVHMGSVGHVNPPGSPYFPIREVVLGPGGAANPSERVGPLKRDHTGPNKQFQFVTGTNNYTMLTCNPDATGRGGKLTVRFVGVLGRDDRDVFHTHTFEI